MPIGRLHIITDFHLQQRHSHDALARLASEGGADTIQFRQKLGTIRHKLHNALLTADACATAGTPLIIDDHLSIALRIPGAGVHVGQEDFPVADARKVLGQRCLGATANTTAQAVKAWQEGASYIGFGPVFPTSHKANPSSVRGLAGLSEVCAAIPIPVIAIAGITPERVQSVLEAGAHGVAVLGAVCLAEDPLAATRRFRQAIDQHLATQP